MGVGTYERIGKTDTFLPNILCKILKIDLMTDSNSRRYDAKSVKSLRAPFQELISGPVAFEFHLHVFFKCVSCAGEVDLNGVIDDEIHRNKGFDDASVLSQTPDG